MYSLIKSILTEVSKNLSNPLSVSQRSKYKKGLKKHKHDKKVADGIKNILKHLIYNKDLPGEYNDHPLKNNMKGYRIAHIKGQQVILLYKITDDGVDLVGLGSHTELGIM